MIGMGDHVPDFILRSFALKQATADEATEAAAETREEAEAGGEH